MQTTSLALQTMLPVDEQKRSPTRGSLEPPPNSSFALSSLEPRVGGTHVRARPLCGHMFSSSIDMSTMAPLQVEAYPPRLSAEATAAASQNRCHRPPHASGTYASQVHAAQAAGDAAAHVTDSSHPPAPGSAWGAEVANAAGASSAVAARKEASGSCHYFAQSVWPNREGLEPFHGPQKMSERGRHHHKGHWIPGQPNLADGPPDELNHTPQQRSPRRGKREVAVPPVPAMSSSRPDLVTDASPPITPGRRRQTAAHRETFDGCEMRALIGGEELRRL